MRLNPAVSIENDYDYVVHHPLAESYVLYEPPHTTAPPGTSQASVRCLSGIVVSLVFLTLGV